jgi:hypothetical protein
MMVVFFAAGLAVAAAADYTTAGRIPLRIAGITPVKEQGG